MATPTATAATSTDGRHCRLRFVKRATGKYDAVELLRPSGDIERLENPKQGIAPHDMVHVLIEQALGMTRGFIGMVVSGLPMAMTDQPRERERVGLYGLEAKQSESLVECVQAALWDSAPVIGNDFRELLRVTCEIRQIPAPVLDDATVQHLVDVLRDASRQWQALPPGQAMEFRLGVSR